MSDLQSAPSPWRPIEEAPKDTPIAVKMGGWIATVMLNPSDDTSAWCAGDKILHYNGEVLLNGFRGNYDGWLPLSALGMSGVAARELLFYPAGLDSWECEHHSAAQPSYRIVIDVDFKDRPYRLLMGRRELLGHPTLEAAKGAAQAHYNDAIAKAVRPNFAHMNHAKDGMVMVPREHVEAARRLLSHIYQVKSDGRLTETVSSFMPPANTNIMKAVTELRAIWDAEAWRTMIEAAQGGEDE